MDYTQNYRVTILRGWLPDGAWQGVVQMGPAHVARLAAWKARLGGRRWVDRYSGYRALRVEPEAWARRWLQGWSREGVSGWLRRPGAGRLWVGPDAAPEWSRRTCTAADMALAADTARGVFDLLGSGPQALGSPPAWRKDLYSAKEWPLEHAHRIPLVRGDGSDIRTVWELSRGYHFVALARAHHTAPERDSAAVFRRHVLSWIEQNPVGHGPHWRSPMDAALRAANWVLACHLFADADGLDAAFWAVLLENLRTTGRFVARYPEWHPVYRGNHYVANAVGLLYLGVLFRDDAIGARWFEQGARILAEELLYQVHEDGVTTEVALGYHRLVTELCTHGADLVRRNAPELWSAAHEERLAAMHAFMAAYLPPSGLAPMIGDADDGRLHLLDVRSLLEPRRHALGMPGWSPPNETAERRAWLFRKGGFAVFRHGRDHCIVRCGAVGLRGAGSHDHNDQLSFELVVAGQRLIRDSGTYCYTRDLEARGRFRGTAAHNALQLGGQEQNPIRVDRPWRILADRTRARVVEWHQDDEQMLFSGEHRGFQHLQGSPLVRRTIRWTASDGCWTIDDHAVPTAAGAAASALAWRLHLEGPAEVLETANGRAVIQTAAATLDLTYPSALRFGVGSAPSSHRYGHSRPEPVLELEGEVDLPVRIKVCVTPHPG